MGNGSSELQAQPIDPKLLRGDILADRTFMYDITVHHTSQLAYSKYRIIKFTQVDRRNEGRIKLKNRSTLQFCLEKNFQLLDLLNNASVPSKCRHPSVLCIHRFLLDPVNSCLFLVAEASLPLATLIQHCDVEDFLLGARSILSAIDFVHRILSLSHNNIRLNSLFVTADSRWKLSGFEYSLPFEKMNHEIAELLELLLHDGENLNTASAYNRNYPFCYDIYAFSRLFTQLVSQRSEPEFEIFAPFLQVLHRSCMHGQPKVRLPPLQLLAHPVFQHPLSVATEFVESYMTHTDEEKSNFFNRFREQIAQRLSPEVLCKKLLPKCLENNIFLDPPSQSFVAQLLHPYPDDTEHVATETRNTADVGLLGYSTFRKYVNPLILGKFRQRERLTRLTLLQHFSGYAHLLQTCELRDCILPEVCLGVFDHYDPLSSWSLRALGDLSTRLGATATLNMLRAVEARLRRDNKLPGNVTNKTHCSDWPRAPLFSEAAPKISRSQREVPLSEQRSLGGVNGTGFSLAQLASLSADYNPDSNPQLMYSNDDDDNGGTRGSKQSIPLEGNVRKISKPKTTNPGILNNSGDCESHHPEYMQSTDTVVSNPNTVELSRTVSGGTRMQKGAVSETWTTNPQHCTSNGGVLFNCELIKNEQQIDELLTTMEPRLPNVHRQDSSSSANPANAPVDGPGLQVPVESDSSRRLRICDSPGHWNTRSTALEDDETAPGDGWEEAWDPIA